MLQYKFRCARFLSKVLEKKTEKRFDKMSSILRKEISDGVFFNSVKDSRFKTMKISVNIIVPLAEQTASSNALLCGVLTRSCKAYPDFTILSKKLSSLYGADLSSSLRKSGDRQILTLSASGLDDRYAFDGEIISKELSSLLCGVLFEPYLNGKAFVENEVEQERRQLLDLIDSEFNDKRIYAIGQLVKNMCKNEAFGIKRYGTAEKINSVTPSSLYSTWQNILKTAVFEIFYIGESSADKAQEVFANAFSKISRSPVELENKVIRHSDSVNHVTEEMELSQSKLVMGFRTDSAVMDDDVIATRLMCAVLGGTANSKLFCNVREKQSLCYYCSSRFDMQKGIMYVDSGVEGDNLEKAEKAILKEIEDIQNGNISDFEIDATKMAVINSFNSSNDTVGGIDLWYTSQMFSGSFKTIDELSAEINAVTKQQLVDAAKKLTLDTVYVLKNK